MRFWWVNHKQTARQELSGGYLWSPKTEARGTRSQFYDIYGRLPRKAICRRRRLECTNLSGLLRDDLRPWP
jgi:hypothetical protein